MLLKKEDLLIFCPSSFYFSFFLFYPPLKVAKIGKLSNLLGQKQDEIGQKQDEIGQKQDEIGH